MQIHSDRFETVLPKTERFIRSKPPKVQWPSQWAVLLAGALMGAAILGALIPKNSSPAGAAIPAPTVAPTPAPPLPEVRQPTLAPPAPAPVADPPRAQLVVSEPPHAQLVHLRPIGTYQNALMPDGRILSTLYKGELPSARNLPTHGGELGDMWYTRADNHTWVLAPVTGGSQAIGWVDP